MNFIIDAKNLRDSLKAIKPWIPVNPHHKITDHILLTIGPDGTHITNCDVSGNAVRFPLDATVSNEGGCAVRFKDLNDIMQKAEGDVTVHTDVAGKLTISFDHTVFTLKARSEEEFPALPSGWNDYYSGQEIDNSQSCAFGEFADAVNHVYIATGRSAQKVHFTNGILINSGVSGVVLVGTDGRRLHYASVDGWSNGPDWESLVPADIPLRIAMLKADRTSRLHFGIKCLDSETFFSWAVDEIEGFCPVLDTPFPEWEKVIPTENEGLIEVAADALSRSIVRISPIAKSDDGRDMIVLNGNSAVTVSARSESMGSGESTIDCNHISGPDMRVALNYSYLLDVLKLHKGKNVHLIYQGDLDPVMIRSSCDGTRSSVLMPVRLPED